MASIIPKWWCNFNYAKLWYECSKSFAHVVIIISLNAIFLVKSQWIEVPISLTAFGLKGAFAVQCIHSIECGRWFTLMFTNDSFHKTKLSGMSNNHIQISLSLKFKHKFTSSQRNWVLLHIHTEHTHFHNWFFIFQFS